MSLLDFKYGNLGCARAPQKSRGDVLAACWVIIGIVISPFLIALVLTWLIKG